MDYTWGNIKNIYQEVVRLGMLTAPEDIIACNLVYKTLPHIGSVLELGAYIGGGIALFNNMFLEQNRKVKFVGVDHLEFIGAKAQNKSGAWYSDHFNKCLTEQELISLSNVSDINGATAWIKDRCIRLTGNDLDLTCYRTEEEVKNLNDAQFDIVHHDYGDSVSDSLQTIYTALPKMKSTGIYIVDDWCTGAPLRTWATVIACQQGLLFPLLWGKNKVFFTKSASLSKYLAEKILADSTLDTRVFRPMPGSEWFGTDYKTIRMQWQGMNWS